MAAPNRLENLQTLRMANADSAFSTAFATLVTGTFLVGFIKYLGGSDIWIGLLAAVPNLLGLLQIPGGIVGRAQPFYKKFVFPGGLVWRLIYMLLIPLPLLPVPNEVKLWILAGCVAAASASVLFVTPIHNDWLAELVPASSRGFFFSRRNAIATATGSVVGLGGAFLLDAFRRVDQDSLGYTAIFSLASVCSLISLFLFTRMHETPRPNPISQTLREGLRALTHPFVDREFRRVLVYLGAAVFGQVFAGALFAAFAIESLRLPFTIIQGTAVFHALGNVLTAGIWGFLSDKYGNKPILILVGFALTLTPVMWLFCEPGNTMRNAAILLPSHILVGATWAGVSLCQFNIVLATAKPEDRANYLGVTLAVQALVGFVSPLLGAQLLTVFRGGMSPEDAYKAVFVVVMVLRFAAVFFLMPVREEGALQVRRAIRDLSRVTPKGFQAMRKLASSADAQKREEAIGRIAEEGYSLGGDEVLKALHDPSPRVRRQAALSIAKLGDPNGASELIHQLREHPDLVEEETIEALGQIGGEESVEPLVGMLRSPRSMLRRAAAKALGRIGRAEAIQPLIEAAAEPGDPDLRRASLQALRALGAREAEAVIADALLDPTPSVRIAAAEAVSELELTSAKEQLRESLSYYADEASSESAYALGAVGGAEDIPMILKEAQRSMSVITRRRCLLGIARALGVEQSAYRLLLAEGMARDTMLMTVTKPLLKSNRGLRDAVQLYSGGDEPGALKALVAGKHSSVMLVLAEHPVQELFLVAVTAFISAHQEKSPPSGAG